MIEFTIQSKGVLKKFFDKVIRRLDNPKTALQKASLVMLRSIDKNFRAEGRPRKWTALAPMTVGFRRKKSKRILQDTGRLKGSITAQVHKDFAKIGTNLAYAPLLHKGGMTKPKTLRIKQHKRRQTRAFGKPITPKIVIVRAHSMRIGSKKVVARPFILFQREDIADINKLFLIHVKEAVK